ncbi:MAG: ABC transporter permease [Acidobacteria bacterium]|nr:ABC transporter permease [Acidobacteriota bacterium]
MENLVFSNMMHRPARTVVSILGIAVGVLLIVFTVGLANGSIREQARRDANVGAELRVSASGSIGIGGPDAFRLLDSLPAEIAKVKGVRSAVGIGQNSVDAPDNNTGKRTVDGINFDEYAAISGLRVIDGRAFTPGTDEVIIDSAWQRQKGYKVGDTTPIYERQFKIVGIYEPAGGPRIKMSLDSMQKQLGSENKISSVLVAIDANTTIEETGLRLQEAFPDLQVVKLSDLEELYMSGMPAMNIFLNVFIGIAAAISALVILLTMYTTVTERTRQIGILKSLGMSNGKIAWTITQEALIISLGGIIVGLILTVVMRYGLNLITTLEVEISPTVVATVVIIGLIGGALGAFYPAMRAAKLDAVEALSYE